MALEFSPRIARIPVYPAAAAYGADAPMAMLASNESYEPPLDAVLEAGRRALSEVNRYPDPTCSRLRRALSDRYGVPAARIAIGNGSCDILLAAGEALLEPGAELVYAWPSFSVYPHLAAASGATAVTVPLDLEDRHDLPALAAAVTAATRLVIVCNPNNPTSTAVALWEISELLRAVPRRVCVVLDEAYCEFGAALEDPDASIELLLRHPNLVLLRTFSKVHGLAGLRTGFALCASEELRVAVDQVRQPFYANHVAQAAATEALRHQDAMVARVERTIAQRLGVEEGLREMGLHPAASQANFTWFSVGDNMAEGRVVSGLAERGVLVRAGSALGRPGALRGTVGSAPENARLLGALRELL